MPVAPKKAPTVRDPDDVFQREAKNIIKQLRADVDKLLAAARAHGWSV